MKHDASVDVARFSPDGKRIVTASWDGTARIWDAESGRALSEPMKHDAGVKTAQFSPDGKWIVYDSWTNGSQRLWRIPIDGGEPQMLTNHTATESDISPDGKFIACFYLNEQENKNWEIAIIPFEGGVPIKFLPVPQTVAVDNSPLYTPDGKSITYIDWTGDVSNLWSVPIDGGPAKQLTNYKQDYIFRREWTRDGKQVAIVRGSETSDAVMITDFR
jgi:Tol biopolymer transport system component